MDTSVLVDLLRGDEDVTERLALEDETLGLAYPMMCELYKGVYKSDAPDKGEEEVGGLLRQLELVDVGPEAAQAFGRLKQSHPEASEFDLMIAGIVSAANATLLTRDSDFEAMPEIDVELV